MFTMTCQRLIESSGGQVEVGGVVDVEDRYVSPTVISGETQERVLESSKYSRVNKDSSGRRRN